ncbi:MAG: peptide/nickel transport system ATP-binding protein [Paracoccaceae bacterium]
MAKRLTQSNQPPSLDFQRTDENNVGENQQGMNMASESRRGETILEIKDICIELPKGADRTHAVKNVSLSVKRGEILCIVGESGSGKSVLTSAIMNDVPPRLTVTQGEVLFDGKDVLKFTDAELCKMRGARISMIYQEPMAALNPAMKIGKQVDEVLKLHRPEISASDRREETLKLLEQMRLPMPPRIYDSYPHQVSGGQCQRVVIAMALACKPDVLIADEPTTALDVTTQAEILRLINDLKDVYDNATIFITHDFGVVADIADRVAVMCWGEVIEQGPAEQILMHPQQDYTKLLVDAMPALETTRMPDKTRTDPPKVEAKHLHKVYGSGSKQVHALNDASFVLRSGETLGVVGESGSGKSTLAKALIRLIEPTSGNIIINEQDFLGLKGATLQDSRRLIQMIFQDPYGSLNPTKTVGDIITRGPILRGVSASEAKDRAIQLLEMVGLQPEAFYRTPRNFSGGQRQRIGVARALSMEPDVVIADESVSALDLSVQKQVLRLMNELQERLQIAIIFITHDLRVAAQISDYITVMQKGVMVEFGTADDVFNNPKHEYTKMLLAAAPGRDWHPPRLAPEEAARISAELQRG